MAKQLVNTGTAVNSRDGDSIRTAFIKINSNFDELYGSSSIKNGTSDITILDPDGSIIVNSNTSTWAFNPDGSLTVPGNINSESSINIEINLLDSTLRRWQFSEDGNLTLPAGGTVSYTPTTASDWYGAVPVTIQEAIDRLATVVKTLNSGTGA